MFFSHSLRQRRQITVFFYIKLNIIHATELKKTPKCIHKGFLMKPNAPERSATFSSRVVGKHSSRCLTLLERSLWPKISWTGSNPPGRTVTIRHQKRFLANQILVFISISLQTSRRLWHRAGIQNHLAMCEVAGRQCDRISAAEQTRDHGFDAI